jgi:hypothetical protein
VRARRVPECVVLIFALYAFARADEASAQIFPPGLLPTVDGPGVAGPRVAGPGVAGPGVVRRHEPIFGVGPHTTWRGGWGVEVEAGKQGDETIFPVEILYGVTEELSTTLVLPFGSPTSAGSLGEVGLRAKWRFATKFSRGQMDALALVGGMTIPRSTVSDAPVGGPNAMLGLAAGRESRRWYYFAGVRGIMRFARDGLDRGESLLGNLAWGIRPRLSEYKAPDLVLLLEANGRFTGMTTSDGTPVDTSGRRVISVSPAFLFSIRNVMLKGGIDIPVWSSLNDPLATAGTTIVAALELHW